MTKSAIVVGAHLEGEDAEAHGVEVAPSCLPCVIFLHANGVSSQTRLLENSVGIS